MMAQKAFSLVEALVAVALFTMMFGVLMSTLIMGRQSFQSGPEQQNIQNMARQAMEAMSRELFNATASKVTLTGSTIITFQVPIGYDMGGNLQWGADGVQWNSIRYAVASGELQRTILDTSLNPVGSPRVIATDVQSISFSLSGKTLTIAATLQKNIMGRLFSESLSSKVTFRN